MTIDTDLATLREQLLHLGPWRGAVGDEALDRVEAELARLRRVADQRLRAGVQQRQRAERAERELARLRRENESLKRWQLAYAKGREGLVKQADQDFERAEAAERELARLREGLRDAVDAMERMDAAIETNSEQGTPEWFIAAEQKARALLAKDGAA